MYENSVTEDLFLEFEQVKQFIDLVDWDISEMHQKPESLSIVKGQHHFMSLWAVEALR